MAFWTLLALVHVAVILWGAWRHRLVPDRQTTGEPAPRWARGWFPFWDGPR